MKHLNFGGTSLLLGDEAADLLLEYAALLTQRATGDTVELAAISSDEEPVTATFLLGPGATMMAETTPSALPEPDNAAVVADVRDRILRLTVPVEVQATDRDFRYFGDAFEQTDR